MPACPASYALRSGEVTACDIWKPQAMKQQYPFITPSIPKKSWPFSVNFWEKTFEKNIGKNYAKRLTLKNQELFEIPNSKKEPYEESNRSS